MQAWTLSGGAARQAQRALAATIQAVGRPGFAATALGPLNDAFGAASWSVYRLWPDRPPQMHLSASVGVPDTTGACFAIYRDVGLYRRDRSFDAVRASSCRGEAVMLRMHADEAPSADHREAIYRRHGMVERLSVACGEADGSLLAVNLYSHQPSGGFATGAVEHFGSAAPLLLAAVRRHVDWQHGDATAAPLERRAALRARCPGLTPRELDVLEHLLDGLTYDGIAASLALSVATVKTYRARAFERLGIHFKNQLFAAFALPPRPPRS